MLVVPVAVQRVCSVLCLRARRARARTCLQNRWSWLALHRALSAPSIQDMISSSAFRVSALFSASRSGYFFSMLGSSLLSLNFCLSSSCTSFPSAVRPSVSVLSPSLGTGSVGGAACAAALLCLRTASSWPQCTSWMRSLSAFEPTSLCAGPAR